MWDFLLHQDQKLLYLTNSFQILWIITIWKNKRFYKKNISGNFGEVYELGWPVNSIRFSQGHGAFSFPIIR